MEKDKINITISLDEDTIEKLETGAAKAAVNTSDFVSDLIDASLPQKRVYGKRTKERQEILYCQKLDDIIKSIAPEQRDLKQKLIELQEYGRELLWHI